MTCARGSTVVAISCTLSACILDAGVGHWAQADVSVLDAMAPDAGDTTCAEASLDASTCPPRDGSSALADLTVSLGSTTTYFASGASLPAGEYSVAYVDGCWRSSIVAWTVNLGAEGYSLVGGVPEAPIVMAPGTVGTFADLGAYNSYEECVQANRGQPPVTFRSPGSPLGMNLSYPGPIMIFLFLDDGSSAGGRAPTFRLHCIDCR